MLKISWITIIQTDPLLEAFAYKALSPILKDQIWWCNISYVDIKNHFKNTFWCDVLLSWLKINFKTECQSKDEIESQIIWYNSRIKIAGKCIVIGNAIKKGLFTVGQLFQGGNLLSCEEICSQYQINYMQFNSIITAIPKEWMSIMQTGNTRGINTM